MHFAASMLSSVRDRSFFQLGQQVCYEAYRAQISILGNKSMHRRRWYNLHKNIFEFSTYWEAHVILEIHMSSGKTETARVLSTWDLEGAKSFLEVRAPNHITIFLKRSQLSSAQPADYHKTLLVAASI